MRLPFPTLLTLTLLTGGCALNPFGSGNLGEYDLVSIHGEQLPAAYIVQPGTNLTLVEVLSSRIVLRDDRTGEEKVKQRQPGGRVEEITNRFSFQTEGAAIRITYDCPDFASCIAGPHLIGRTTDSGLVFDSALGRTPLVLTKR